MAKNKKGKRLNTAMLKALADLLKAVAMLLTGIAAIIKALK